MTTECAVQVLACLKNRHRQQHHRLEDLITAAVLERSPDCLIEVQRVFGEFAERALEQMGNEEELLPRLYGPVLGELSTLMSRDHQRIRDLIEQSRQHLEARELDSFAESVNVLRIRFEMHVSREERMLTERAGADSEDDEAAHRFMQSLSD
jgi:hypothetical protein